MPLPPRLVDVIELDNARHLAIGREGTIYFTLPKEAGPHSEYLLVAADADGDSRRAAVLDAGASIRAIAPDGRGAVWVALHLDGADQIWSFPEGVSGKSVRPTCKLSPKLPARLNSLFCQLDGSALFVLCGGRWVVELATDGGVKRMIELPGRGRPVAGGIDSKGSLYIWRLGVGVARLLPDGSRDPAWRKGDVIAVTMPRAMAVSAEGLLYLSAQRGEIVLSAYDAQGALAFNVVAEQLDEPPVRLAAGRRGRLYALVGHRLLVFEP
jgi:hypothetical protein